jgi:hypothetical protein
MPLAPTRTLRIPCRYAVFMDGIDDYVVITPFTVYGWSEITIQEWIYAFHPKANNSWSKCSMIGDYWTDRPSTFHSSNDRYDYTVLQAYWYVRKPDGTIKEYAYDIYAYRNTWVNVARRFNNVREYAGFINGAKTYSTTVPSDYKTVLEWNPDTATYPTRYKRFVLGANSVLADYMKLMQFQLLIYDRALSDAQIAWNMNNPFNPVRDGLVLCFIADPQYVMDIDNDGILEWIDLSGYGNHGKIYGATLVDLYKTPARTLPAVRSMPVAR